MFKTSLRLVISAALLLPIASEATARVVAGAAVRSPMIAPAPLGALRAPLAAPGLSPLSLSAPSLKLDSSLPSLLPVLEPALPAALAAQAFVRPAASPTAARRAEAGMLPRIKPLPGARGAKIQNTETVAAKNGAVIGGALAATAQNAPPLTKANLGAARFEAGRLFDGTRKIAGTVNAADVSNWRNPTWSEDRRINRALNALYRSETGTALYQDIRRNHAGLKIRIDPAQDSYYDARIRWEDGNPVLYLTKNLVARDSTEVIAAYIAREFTDLYFNDFPASVEMNYLAHGSMLRVFAELTGSGLSRRNYWWATAKDQRVGNSYAMQSYFASWKKAAYNLARYGSAVSSSEFYTYLRDQDISNKDPNSRKSIREHYRDGSIAYNDYRRFAERFNELTRAEGSWFGDTGRW